MDVVEVGPLLGELAATVGRECRAGLELSCPDDLAAMANRDLLEQALANLVANAVRHAKDGRVRLLARENDGGSSLTIEVQDAGPGIPVQDQACVFERFFRADSCGGDRLGLGLAIAKQAVEAVGGTIAVESRPAGGTTVRLTLSSASRREG